MTTETEAAIYAAWIGASATGYMVIEPSEDGWWLRRVDRAGELLEGDFRPTRDEAKDAARDMVAAIGGDLRQWHPIPVGVGPIAYAVGDARATGTTVPLGPEP